MPIIIHTEGVVRGRGRRGGRGRRQLPSPQESSNSRFATDSEGDSSEDRDHVPPSPQSPENVAPQSPPPDPSLAAMHAILARMAAVQETMAQNMVQSPSQPDFAKMVMLMKNLGTPSFEGSSNPMDADQWMECLERHFTAIRCPSTFRKDIAVFYLVKDASNWWITVERRYAHQVINYETFRQEFQRKYFPSEARDRLEVEYLELTQGSKSVRDYEAEFTRLRRYVVQAQHETEAAAVRRFMRGLHPEIHSRLQAMEYFTLTDLVERAVKVEESVTRLSALNVQTSQSRPVQASQQQTFRRRGKDSSKSRRGSRCTKCNRFHSGECTQAVRACYTCGDTSHLARDCPRAYGAAPTALTVPPHIRCFICEQPGHYATSCPQRRPPIAAGPSRPQLPPPPAKRPATNARVYSVTAPKQLDMGKGPLAGE